jgi:hypothetical protein
MGRRSDIRLARAMLPIGQRPGNIARLIARLIDRLGTHRVDPHAHAHATNHKILLRSGSFRIGL